MSGRATSGRGDRLRRPVATVATPLAVVVLGVVLLAGCRVTTAVRVEVTPTGRGSVTVVVDLDAAASRAVGGVTDQLRVGDLAAAGWRVRTETPPGGSTDVELTHGFTRLSQLPGILGEVARSPTGDAPLFRIRVTQTRSSFRITTTAAGDVDLTCGVSCFGDAALARVYGSDVGVDATALEGRRGAALAARDLPFSFTLGVPGRVTASDSPDGPTSLHWAPVLGRRTVVAASASAFDGSPVPEASSAAAVTVVVLVVVLVVVVVVPVGATRRRRARRRARGVPPSPWTSARRVRGLDNPGT